MAKWKMGGASGVQRTRHGRDARVTGECFGHALGDIQRVEDSAPVAGQMSRGAFLARAGVAALVALCTAQASLAADATAPSHIWKGRKNPKIKRWDVITIGNLSRNRYWGEGDAKGLRSVLCTCTLITGENFRLLVDPSVADATEMAKELDRRTGLKPDAITAAFVTHEHGDHYAGLANFPDARWLASPGVAEILNKSGKFKKPIEPVTGMLFDAVDVVPTPGHTNGHNSLRFDCEGMSIVTAGDAVATHDFFRDRRAFYNAVDFAVSGKTMDKLAAIADIIVPGHDNYFLVD